MGPSENEMSLNSNLVRGCCLPESSLLMLICAVFTKMVKTETEGDSLTWDIVKMTKTLLRLTETLL